MKPLKQLNLLLSTVLLLSALLYVLLLQVSPVDVGISVKRPTFLREVHVLRDCPELSQTTTGTATTTITTTTSTGGTTWTRTD